MALFKPFRGTRVTLPQELHDGYAYFCTDDGSFHIDFTDADGNLQRKQINAKDAETLTGMTLEEIKAYVTIQPDWNQADETKADYIKNKPSIPTVNNGTLTIKQNGTNGKTFTANSASNVIVDIAIPTKLSQLAEDDNHQVMTADEKTKLAAAITETEFNQALSKANAELNKRPVAYSSYKGEYTWEFSGNIDDYESTVLGSPDGTDTNTMIAIKILDVAPSAEERELIIYIMHTEMFPGGTPSVNQTSGQWSAFNGDERAYAVFLNDSSLPVIAAVYSTVSEDGISITPGLWVMQMLINGENMLGVQSLNAPMVTIPGVKMSADLIDAEWMATSSTHDLNIVITPETAGSFEVIDDANGGSATKLSDVAPTLEQLKSGAFTIGTETISFADTTITQEEGLDGYVVNNMLMVVNNDTHFGQITLEKGMYVLGEINNDFFAYLDTNYVNIYIPNIVPGVNPLPEKFIPDTIARSSDIAKANWSQNDENAIDYVKNRTHWIESSIGVKEYSWTLHDSGGWMSGTDLEFAILFHENYRNSILIGLDTYVEDITGTSSYEPDNCYTYVFKRSSNNAAKIFVRLYHNNGSLTGEYSVGEHSASWGTETIAIPYNNEVVHPLNEKFIPETIARKEYVDAQIEAIPTPNMSAYETKEDAQAKYDELKNIKSDWSQNDANALDYVKNRTHWVEYGKVLVLAETTEKGFSEDYEWVWGEEPPVTSLPYIIRAENYVVTLNNISYPVTGWSYTNDIGETSNWLGDSRKLQEVWGEDPLAIAIKDINPVEVPFLIYQEEYVVHDAEFPGDASQYRNNFQIYTNNNADLVKIERLTDELEYHTLDKNYLPMDDIFEEIMARMPVAEEASF